VDDPKLKAVKSDFGQLQKFVGVTVDGDRFVEFNFAIGDPSLFVELILPRKAFVEFCEKNSVQIMSAEEMAGIDEEAAKWRYGDETLVGKNKGFHS